jgi:hypothetical protein
MVPCEETILCTVDVGKCSETTTTAHSNKPRDTPVTSGEHHNRLVTHRDSTHDLQHTKPASPQKPNAFYVL